MFICTIKNSYNLGIFIIQYVYSAHSLHSALQYLKLNFTKIKKKKEEGGSVYLRVQRSITGLCVLHPPELVSSIFLFSGPPTWDVSSSASPML